MKETKQFKVWRGKFGEDYTNRNSLKLKDADKLCLKNYGITRTGLNKEFLNNFNRSIKILEVGANIGNQLLFLQKLGFLNLYGIEINKKTVELSKKNTKGINIIEGSALDIPFKDNYFDLVFTSGVLIHISPQDIKTAMKEIYRCTKKYIWGFEYYADEYTEIPYRRKRSILWKANFSGIYLKNLKDLKLIKEKKT